MTWSIEESYDTTFMYDIYTYNMCNYDIEYMVEYFIY